MVFYKNVEVKELKLKYGDTHKGLIVQEAIKKGEAIWSCNCAEKDGSFTRDQLLEIIRQHPHLDYFVRSFSYMIDDDLYAMPLTYLEEKNNDECAYFNHSCSPNCGFSDAFGDQVVAIRDIQVGEELTYHYGILETESSLIYGLKCMCNSAACCGRLNFDFYRDPQFVETYFDYMTPYLKQKAIDNKEKWCSSSCYVKRYPAGNQETRQPEEWDKGLCSLKHIKQGELVASFAGQVAQDKHFLRNSLNPNCHLVGREVFANVDIPPETELTLYYHGILL